MFVLLLLAFLLPISLSVQATGELSNYRLPFYGSKDLLYGSSKHNNLSQFAIDVDLGVDTGVYADQDGYVLFAGWRSDGYGHTLVLMHDNGYMSLYGHLSGATLDEGDDENDPVYFAVNEGDFVGKGDLVAFSGESGQFGKPAHLHYEVVQNALLANDTHQEIYQEVSFGASKMSTHYYSNTQAVSLSSIPNIYTGDGPPVFDPACGDRSYTGIDIFDGKYCQDTSLYYSNQSGYQNISVPNAKSIFVGSGWSAFLSDGINVGICINRNLWDLSKDFYPHGASVEGNIAQIMVYPNSTCDGYTTPYDPEDVGSGGTGGGGSNPSGYLSLYNLSNYASLKGTYGLGSHTFPANTVIHSVDLESAGSFIVYAADGRSRCFNEDIPNLQDHESWAFETIRMDVYMNIYSTF